MLKLAGKAKEYFYGRLRAGELIESRSERGLSRLIKYARYDLLMPEEKNTINSTDK